jgi:hypothetical protein
MAELLNLSGADIINAALDAVAKEVGVSRKAVIKMIDGDPDSELHQRFVAYVILAAQIRAGKVPDRSKMS